jgi:hypothetical protein
MICVAVDRDQWVMGMNILDVKGSGKTSDRNPVKKKYLCFHAFSDMK